MSCPAPCLKGRRRDDLSFASNHPSGSASISAATEIAGNCLHRKPNLQHYPGVTPFFWGSSRAKTSVLIAYLG